MTNPREKKIHKFPSKAAAKEAIEALLMRPDAYGMHAIGRALSDLLDRQEPIERARKEVLLENGKGFVTHEVNIGTSVAEQYRQKGKLSDGQVKWWREPNKPGQKPRILKYAGQLVEIAIEKQRIVIERSGRSTHVESEQQTTLNV